MCKRVMFAMTFAYKSLQNENFPSHIIHHSEINSYLKLLIESLLRVLINRINKSDSPVKLREKMLNCVVKYCETAERKSDKI